MQKLRLEREDTKARIHRVRGSGTGSHLYHPNVTRQGADAERSKEKLPQPEIIMKPGLTEALRRSSVRLRAAWSTYRPGRATGKGIQKAP